MQCPHCGLVDFQQSLPCPECGFHGPAEQLELLSHLDFLLKEISSWDEIPVELRTYLQAHYVRRRRELEAGLGLREPLLDEAETRAARLNVARLQAVRRTVHYLYRERVVTDEAVRRVDDEIQGGSAPWNCAWKVHRLSPMNKATRTCSLLSVLSWSACRTSTGRGWYETRVCLRFIWSA